MKKYTRYSLEERIKIEKHLELSSSLTTISRILNRDLSGLRKEIKNHLIKAEVGAQGRNLNNCAYRITCQKRMICERCNYNHRPCRSCHHCNSICNDFQFETCSKLDKKPYCCNRCSTKVSCFKTKYFYRASFAHTQSNVLRSSSRSGLSYSPDELEKMNLFLQSQVKEKSQSIHAVVQNNKDVFPISERHIYNLINQNVFTTRNIDLSRKVRFIVRKKRKDVLVDHLCRVNRTYDDFLKFQETHPHLPITEMDTVIGNKHTSDCLLTLFFRSCSLQFSFIRELNNARSVIEVFDSLYHLLGHDDFVRLFPVLLCDNGFEFSNPKAIEFHLVKDEGGNIISKTRRTYLFYCNPASPYQKGACERNHEFIRLFFPKGSSFKDYSQDDIHLMMTHINNYQRKKMNHRSPYQLFIFLYGQEIADKLGLVEILPNDVCLNNSIFK